MNNIRYSVITTTVSSLLDKNQSDLAFLQQRVDKTLPTQLETLQNKDNYCHLTYPYHSYSLTIRGTNKSIASTTFPSTFFI